MGSRPAALNSRSSINQAANIFGGLTAGADNLHSDEFHDGSAYLERPNAQLPNLTSSQLPQLNTVPKNGGGSGSGSGQDVGQAIKDGFSSGLKLDGDSIQQLANALGQQFSQTFQ